MTEEELRKNPGPDYDYERLTRIATDDIIILKTEAKAARERLEEVVRDVRVLHDAVHAPKQYQWGAIATAASVIIATIIAIGALIQQTVATRLDNDDIKIEAIFKKMDNLVQRDVFHTTVEAIYSEVHRNEVYIDQALKADPTNRRIDQLYEFIREMQQDRSPSRQEPNKKPPN
jgi:hypothetical protein